MVGTMNDRTDRLVGSAYPVTPDGRYFVVRGRLWRTSNPDLTSEERSASVRLLMHARRDVAKARKLGDSDLMQDARRRVQAAKEALGERGPVWWTDGAPDYNRRMVVNTPYSNWYERYQAANHQSE